MGLLLLPLVGLCGCGGGGTSSGGGSGGMSEINWPTRSGTPTTGLPPAVQIGRVVFDSQSGESCCVAVGPAILTGQQGLAILNDLPVGPATVTVAGFTTDFAPTVPGILATCKTTPANAAHPCDPVQVAAPAFESPPLAVVIVAGVQTNLGPVPMEADPFLFDFSPAQDSSAAAPVQFDLTLVDAVTNIRRDSVLLEVSFTVPTSPGTPSPFRTLSKRVPLAFAACDDGTSVPCSPGGTLELAGFLATGTAPELPEGPVEAHLTAENLADPPHNLDFRYPFMVLATATATATATPTAAATPAPQLDAADDAGSGSATVVAGPNAVGSDPVATARSAGAAAGAAAATPTATPTPEIE